MSAIYQGRMGTSCLDTGAEVIHLPSLMAFPISVCGFRREKAPTLLNPTGYAIQIEYEQEPGWHPAAGLVVSVFVYPGRIDTNSTVQEAIQREIARVEAEMHDFYPDLHHRTEDGFVVMDYEGRVDGRKVTYRVHINGRRGAAAAYLIRRGIWVVLYRATFYRRLLQSPDRYVLDLIDALGVPNGNRTWSLTSS